MSAGLGASQQTAEEDRADHQQTAEGLPDAQGESGGEQNGGDGAEQVGRPERVALEPVAQAVVGW